MNSMSSTNAGGVRHRFVVIARIVPTHIQYVFARVWHEREHGHNMTAARLAEGFKRYSGHEEVYQLSEAFAPVARAFAMEGNDVA